MRDEMTALTRPFRRLLGRGDPAPTAETAVPSEPTAVDTSAQTAAIAVEIAESDPLLAYLQSAPGPVDVARLELDSPALRAMREAGVALVVPLVSQG
jgi:hypothetical protein